MRSKSIGAVIAACLLLAGCGEGSGQEQRKESAKDAAIKACIDNGGVPILDDWNGFLKDCKFPPKPVPTVTVTPTPTTTTF